MHMNVAVRFAEREDGGARLRVHRLPRVDRVDQVDHLVVGLRNGAWLGQGRRQQQENKGGRGESDHAPMLARPARAEESLPRRVARSIKSPPREP